MRIIVRVKTSAKENRVEKTGNDSYMIYVKEGPIEGKANKGVIKNLSEYFDIPKSSIQIIRGEKYKEKIIEIRHSPVGKAEGEI